MEGWMESHIISFIKAHENDIDENNFLKVYTAASLELRLTTDIGELTAMFESVGIQPLDYMQLIPMYYYSGYPEDSINVTSHNIRAIYDYAFMACDKLENVSIPDSVKMISTTAFLSCPKLKYIQYEGSSAEFKKIQCNWKALLVHTPGVQILCLRDGEVIKP
jgi:hypothetical protein